MKSNGLTIEHSVVELLQKGPLTAVELIKRIQTKRPSTTKQGVYRALRKLKKDEEVIIHGKSVSLNLQWVRKMSEFYSLAQFYYASKLGSPDHFLNISGREKVVYYFKNLNVMDIFASHVLHMLDGVVPAREPIYVYNPHEWFAYARKEAEAMLVDAFTESKRAILITSTHRTPLDLALKQRFHADALQYYITEKAISQKDNYYFAIFGDYLIELFLDERTSADIDAFYKAVMIFDEKAEQTLAAIITKTGKNKVTISKNMRKIEIYKRHLAKNFYIPV